MNYAQALDYLYTRLPMFSRIGAAAYKANLDNTIALAEALHHPEQKFKSIHVAGTNGKGSTSHMLAAVLQKAGYKTALYTSPHLLDFRERIKINGQMISEERVAAFTQAHLELFEKIQPSFFEMTVAMAFDWFAEEKVDIAVIETGLGGRLDSTNIIHPELSVITNISFDHMNLLGDTLELIAGEKAGIIKNQIPVIIGERQTASEKVFIEKALHEDAPIHFADEVCRVHDERGEVKIVMPGEKILGPFEPALKGKYQKKNIRTVTAACLMLRDLGWNISEEHLMGGMAACTALTGLRGRWEKLQENPPVYADIAHNQAGIEELLNQIKLTFHIQLHLVMGMVSDKDIDKVLSLLPARAKYYFCKADLPRAMEAAQLAEKAAQFGLKGEVIPDVKTAVKTAISKSETDDLIVISGSAFVVAEALTYFPHS
jgi:dihydrofolate synthase/folylpolyglutamate synthase